MLCAIHDGGAGGPHHQNTLNTPPFLKGETDLMMVQPLGIAKGVRHCRGGVAGHDLDMARAHRKQQGELPNTVMRTDLACRGCALPIGFFGRDCPQG